MNARVAEAARALRACSCVCPLGNDPCRDCEAAAVVAALDAYADGAVTPDPLGLDAIQRRIDDEVRDRRYVDFMDDASDLIAEVRRLRAALKQIPEAIDSANDVNDMADSWHDAMCFAGDIAQRITSAALCGA